MKSIFDCRRYTDPVRYEEFEKIIKTWVDTALKLNDQDLHMMRRLVYSQRNQLEQKLAAQRAEYTLNPDLAAA